MSSSRRRAFAPSNGNDKPGDGLWETYLDAVEDEDKASVESWNGSTTGILTFTGLFAATVAAFVIESYQMLQPDPSTSTTLGESQTVALLAQIVQVLSANQTVPIVSLPAPNPEPFEAPRGAVIVNSLWFLSLVISLICALLATLIQEWTRDFLRDIEHRTPEMPIKAYSLNHIYVRMGVERFKLDYVTSLIVGLMHIAVTLFLIGLAVFLYEIHHVPAIIVEVTGLVAAAIYIALSAMPFWDHSCPYRTPLTYVFVIFGWTTISLLWAIPFVASVALSAVLLISLAVVYLVVGFPILLALGFTIFAVFIIDWIHHSSNESALEKNARSFSSKHWSRLRRAFSQAREHASLVLPMYLSFRRYFIYAVYPKRQLPGYKDVPINVLRDRYIVQKTPDLRLANDKECFFLWKHTSEYLLRPEGRELLLDHLIHRLLNSDSDEYMSFIIYLRQSPAFMQALAESTGFVRSLDTGLGAVRLLQTLVIAQPRLGYDTKGAGYGQWKTMSTLLAHIPSFGERLLSICADATQYIDVLLVLAQLRLALCLELLKLSQQKLDHGPWISKPLRPKEFDVDLQFLRDILHAFESVKGFNLIPLYSDEPDDRSDIFYAYEHGIRSILTLLANLIVLDKTDECSTTHLEPATVIWHMMSIENEFDTFAQASRKRQPSPQLVALLCNPMHAYRSTLDDFAPIFTLPDLDLSHHPSLELEADQTLNDSGVAHPGDPTVPDSPSLQSAEEGVLGLVSRESGGRAA